jgi:hypothetical protein
VKARGALRQGADPADRSKRSIEESGRSDGREDQSHGRVQRVLGRPRRCEVIDKAIAADEILAKVEEGPNTLEEYDQIGSQ